MAVEPQTQTMLEQIALMGAPKAHEQSVEEARAAYDLYGAMSPRPASVTVEDVEVAGAEQMLRARLYRPPASSGAGLVWFHGGGFVIGSIESHDAACGLLAEAGGMAVLSVEYRRAPEHPYPAAIEDGLASFQWIRDHASDSFGVDPARLAIGGDSAGANLATVVCRRLRDEGVALPAAQLLVYPVTDWECERPSVHDNAEGYVLERATMDWFRSNYLPDRSRSREPDASPLAADDLRGLPPAVIATAEFDPLLDQGDAYAARLADAGVPVRHLRYDGLIHTFLQIPAISERSRAATEELGRALAELLGDA